MNVASTVEKFKINFQPLKLLIINPANLDIVNDNVMNEALQQTILEILQSLISIPTRRRRNLKQGNREDVRKST